VEYNISMLPQGRSVDYFGPSPAVEREASGAVSVILIILTI